MRVIGLTGGIASGKSTVARLLNRLGMPVVDADQLAREAVLPGMPALAEIAAEFGEQVLQGDGTLNRGQLAEIIFADSEARRRLEAIMHPAIAVLADARLSELRSSGAPVVVYVAPLLIEAGVINRVDEVWVVYLDRETQLMRLATRDGLSRQEAERRLAAQMPMEEKRKFGRVIIDNRGTAEELSRRVTEICASEFASLVNPDGGLAGGNEKGAGKGPPP
jgi:dephospho-CoA kinase